MVQITLADGSKRDFDGPVTVAEVAQSISPGLAKAALGGKVGGKLVDTSFRIDGDAPLTIITAKDRAGFVVNALLIPYLLAAVRMVDAGLSSAEEVDAAMVGGCAHPMGPLALTDLIGLDTTVAVAESMYAETKERLYAPPALLLRKVEAGELGRKSGRGFFSYA